MRKQFQHASRWLACAPPSARLRRNFCDKFPRFQINFAAEKLKNRRQKRAESVPEPSASISTHSTMQNQIITAINSRAQRLARAFGEIFAKSCRIFAAKNFKIDAENAENLL